MAVRTSTARWEGTLKEGAGTMKLGSGAFEGPFTYVSRFEEGKGTNPEELIGAAHAGCYAMFLSSILSNNGYTPTKVESSAAVHLGAGPTINKIELSVTAEVPGLSAEELADFAQQAKEGCPVSKALAAVDEITLEATLVD